MKFCRAYLCVVFVQILLFGSPVYAYKQSTHATITEFVAEKFDANEQSSSDLYDLGLGASLYDGEFLLPTRSYFFGFPFLATPEELMIHGAVNEDDGKRATNHFFDEQQGGVAIPAPVANYPSPDWAIEDHSQVIGQSYSYKDAKQYLYNAVTFEEKIDRDRNLALLFESLGHVIHHLQDMAQPQHVRGDAHCDDTPFKMGFLYFSQGCKTFPLNLVAYRPSAYEEHISTKNNKLILSGYQSVDYSVFNSPRSFWINNGKGLSELTSNNFVSARTNFRGTLNQMEADPNHPFPIPPGRPGVNERNIEDEDLLGSRGPNQPLHGSIWFVSTLVKDEYTGKSKENPRTSSYSLFESDLRDFGVYPAFSMNRFNYDAAAERLLPRAAGYSLGMLNYFFRGRIELRAPDEGIYSVVDHAVSNAFDLPATGAARGFTKFKIKMRNVTPDSSSTEGTGLPVHQEMSNGTLTAVAKYIVNPCYQPNLLGEYNGSDDFSGVITYNGCTLQQYFGGIENISISAENVGQSLERETAHEYEFDFSDNPIPINAHDLSIQIVYQGVLGEERDAIVVSASNISEPTYITLINGSDYFAIDGDFYTPGQIRADEELRKRVENDHIDPQPLEDVQILLGGTSLVEGGVVPAKGYARLAVLMDAEIRPPLAQPASLPLEIRSRYAIEGAPIQSVSLQLSPIRNQLARQPATISTIDISRRGIPSWSSLYRFKALAGGPDVTEDDVEALPPMKPLCFDGINWRCAPEATPVALVWE